MEAEIRCEIFSQVSSLPLLFSFSLFLFYLSPFAVAETVRKPYEHPKIALLNAPAWVLDMSAPDFMENS